VAQIKHKPPTPLPCLVSPASRHPVMRLACGCGCYCPLGFVMRRKLLKTECRTVIIMATQERKGLFLWRWLSGWVDTSDSLQMHPAACQCWDCKTWGVHTCQNNVASNLAAKRSSEIALDVKHSQKWDILAMYTLQQRH